MRLSMLFDLPMWASAVKMLTLEGGRFGTRPGLQVRLLYFWTGSFLYCARGSGVARGDRLRRKRNLRLSGLDRVLASCQAFVSAVLLVQTLQLALHFLRLRRSVGLRVDLQLRLLTQLGVLSRRPLQSGLVRPGLALLVVVETLE